MDAHVHNLDVINWVLDEPPVRVTAKGGRGPRQSDERYGDIFEYFDCEYEYACGVKLISGSRWSNDKDKPSTKVYEKVIGSKGESNCRDLIQSSDLDPYVEEHRMLLQSIQGGQYINDGVRHGESTLTAIMGRMAAYSGKAVTWDEAFNSQIQLVPGHLDWSKSYPVGPVPAHGI